jgi:glutaminyl-tRNA synthetase
MPTISGLRRRGYTPASIRYFADKVGVARRDNTIDVALLEHSIREDLNKIAPRVMAVINPLRLVITNYPENQTEEVELVNNPEDENSGTRKVPFSRILYIERDDFMEVPPPKYFRLSPGNEVRLKGAYIIKCEKVIREANGEISEIQCTYDPETRSGGEMSNRKVKSTIHWLPEAYSLPAEIRLYDRLFDDENPSGHDDKDFKEFLNPESLKIVQGFVEPSLKDACPLDKFQFIRLGYFCLDPDSAPGQLIFNRTVTLKDTWAKISAKE